MTARDLEAALLARCVAAARGEIATARDQREANAFRLAASVVRSYHPHASGSLRQASDRYFAGHPDEALTSAAVVGNGWVPSLPRLRDMLRQRLA